MNKKMPFVVALLVAVLWVSGTAMAQQEPRVAEEEDDDVIESSMEVFSFDENGQEIDASDRRFRRCGPWQVISESQTCEFVFRCVFRNQRGTVTRTVEQRQCRNAIQQRERTRIRCGC